jgi:hypothetical protein
MNQYLCRSLRDAISILATEQGDVRSRLLEAYSSVLHKLKDDDFPEKHVQDWVWINEQMSKSGPLLDNQGKQICGSIENTMKQIKNSTGAKIAEKIFDIGWSINTNSDSISD